MSKTCVNHREAAAAVMCHRCHNPICSACTIVTTSGSFCSADCNLQFTMFKSAAGGARAVRPKLGVIGWAAAAILLVIAFMIMIHFAARSIPQLEEIDFLGRLIGGVRRILLGN
jgi:hypothetical protein